MMTTMLGFCCAAAGKLIAPVAMGKASRASRKFLNNVMYELLVVAESRSADRYEVGSGILLRSRCVFRAEAQALEIQLRQYETIRRAILM
jgi:hypothetical protein